MHFVECEEGKYGSDCSMECGACLHLKDCDHVTGHCSGGCKPGWMDTQKCDRGTSTTFFSVLLYILKSMKMKKRNIFLKKNCLNLFEINIYFVYCRLH